MKTASQGAWGLSPRGARTGEEEEGGGLKGVLKCTVGVYVEVNGGGFWVKKVKTRMMSSI